MVPYLPTSYLSPNRGERKAGRVPTIISEHKREMRSSWAIWLLNEECVKAITKPPEKANVTLTMRVRHFSSVRPSDGLYRPLDAGNAIYALKAGIDGLKDAGLLVDDDLDHLVALTGKVERVHTRAEEGVLVEVESVDD